MVVRINDKAKYENGIGDYSALVGKVCLQTCHSFWGIRRHLSAGVGTHLTIKNEETNPFDELGTCRAGSLATLPRVAGSNLFGPETTKNEETKPNHCNSLGNIQMRPITMALYKLYGFPIKSGMTYKNVETNPYIIDAYLPN